MRRLIYTLALVLAVTSCEKDPFETFLGKKSYSPRTDTIWDIGPVCVMMEVTDSLGNNLFSDSNPNNWLQKDFSASFNGEDFYWPSSSTKAYLAILKGLYLYPDPKWEKTDKVCLCFGELDGTAKWDSDLHIYWPDGSNDKIRIQHAFRWDEDGNPDFYTGFKLNGMPIQGSIIHLVR